MPLSPPARSSVPAVVPSDESARVLAGVGGGEVDAVLERDQAAGLNSRPGQKSATSSASRNVRDSSGSTPPYGSCLRARRARRGGGKKRIGSPLVRASLVRRRLDGSGRTCATHDGPRREPHPTHPPAAVQERRRRWRLRLIGPDTAYRGDQSHEAGRWSRPVWPRRRSAYAGARRWLDGLAGGRGRKVWRCAAAVRGVPPDLTP